jgi:gluconolactonase
MKLLPLLLLNLFLLDSQTGVAAASVFSGSVQRIDPALDSLIAPGSPVEKLAEGFDWSEGPVWFADSVLFSDVPQNIVYQWKPGSSSATVFLKPSGMLHPKPGFREQGSNGLAVEAGGRLVLCQHGERRLARLETDGTQTPLAQMFDGKRFNSPNDLAIRGNGDIYFTDPPYGLDKGNASPLKEQAHNGVYRVSPSGQVQLLTKSLTFPNGIAFSPDEKRLYVAVSDPDFTRVVAYDLAEDGTLLNERTFFDATPLRSPARKGLCDGLKVDSLGNLFTTGPGGVLVLSPAGKHLGTILTGEATGNCCWGGDGSQLYITADMFLCRIQTLTKGSHLPASIGHRP